MRNHGSGGGFPIEAVTVRATTPDDIPALPAIERSAGQAFSASPELAWIADDDVLDEDAHRRFAAIGWSWVAVAEGELEGFVCAEPAHDEVHIWEVSVRRESQGRGIGPRLISAVEAQARSEGAAALTLTTFRDVPWNGPFYERLGFVALADDQLDPRLGRILELEARAGIPRERRCAMRRVLD